MENVASKLSALADLLAWHMRRLSPEVSDEIQAAQWELDEAWKQYQKKKEAQHG